MDTSTTGRSAPTAERPVRLADNARLTAGLTLAAAIAIAITGQDVVLLVLAIPALLPAALVAALVAALDQRREARAMTMLATTLLLVATAVALALQLDVSTLSRPATVALLFTAVATIAGSLLLLLRTATRDRHLGATTTYALATLTALATFAAAPIATSQRCTQTATLTGCETVNAPVPENALLALTLPLTLLLTLPRNLHPSPRG